MLLLVRMLGTWLKKEGEGVRVLGGWRGREGEGMRG